MSTLEDRVKILRKLVWKGEAAFDRSSPPVGSLMDPQMRQIGLAVTDKCEARDDMCELEMIYRFTKQNVRYTGDITDKDTFSSAWRTLQYGGEDCDGHSVLNAVLAMENGFKTKFRITSNTGETWDHIYCLAGVASRGNPHKWVALDTTLPGNRFGQHPPYAKFQDFDVDEI